ncbi:MAG TPA: hypothetical protein VL095_09865, partial [Flavisolibacter sp.]|nr:hypothetical protein [Flavisolibacter sp.]
VCCLTIQVCKNVYQLDNENAAASGFVVRMDTTAGIWNQASGRLGRLQRKNVNFEHFHFADSYCSKNECYKDAPTWLSECGTNRLDVPKQILIS